MRHRAPVLWLLVPYAVGVGLGRSGAFTSGAWGWLGGAVLLAGLALWLALRERTLTLLAVAAALVCAGLGRYIDARDRLPDWDDLPARALTVEIEISRIFPEKKAPKTPRLRGLGVLRSANDPGQELVGQRVAFTLHYPEKMSRPREGARVRAVAVVRSLAYAPAVDSFDGYLAAQGVNFKADRGRLIAEVERPPAGERWRQNALARCERWLTLGLERHPELVAVYHGMILGQIRALTPDQGRLFAETGTLHLFSVSGLHIGVVALVLHTALGFARCPAKVRVALLLPLLAGYVYLTGSSPAAWRAFGMVALLEWARAWRLPMNPLSALGTTAFVALWLDPLQLFSVSFQYSYSIVASLLLLGQPLAEMAQARWQPFERIPPLLWRPWHHATRASLHSFSSALCLGLSASIVGELCTLQYFHLLTPGGVVANLLLIPLSSLAIVAGMLALPLAALGLSGGAVLFNSAAGVIIHGMLVALRPWHAVEATYTRAAFHQNGFGYGVFLVLLAVLVAGYHCRWRPWRWWLSAPLAALAVALVFGVKFE